MRGAKVTLAHRVRLIAVAQGTLGAPPAYDWIQRPTLRGKPLYQFVLGLDLCPTGNFQLQKGVAGQPWRVGKLKRKVAECMRLQYPVRGEPLQGRPQVIAVRFSSVSPDRCSDWSKWALDVLCKRTPKLPYRLNIITDDRPACAEVHTWWEPGRRGQGFVFIEVRT
jgi:hypothetical protein